MPIYEYYCARNHTVYQFYARSLAQGRITPPCPDNPRWPLKRVVSQFAFTGLAREPGPDVAGDDPAVDDPRMEAAMQAMEREFSSVDENDPKAMARMMRRMSELTGERIDGEMEEVVRKLEEGADPESLEDALGGDLGSSEDDSYGEGSSAASPTDAVKKEARMRWKLRRAAAPRRDPRLHDYPA